MHVCSLRWKRRSNALTYIFLIKTNIYCPPERLEPDCAIFANRSLHNFSVNGQKNAYSIYDSDIGKGCIKIQKIKVFSFPAYPTVQVPLSSSILKIFIFETRISKADSFEREFSSHAHFRFGTLPPSLTLLSPLFRQRMSYPLLRDKPRGKRE